MRDVYPDACDGYVSPDAASEAAMWTEERERKEQIEQRRYRGPAYEH